MWIANLAGVRNTLVAKSQSPLYSCRSTVSVLRYENIYLRVISPQTSNANLHIKSYSNVLINS